MSLIQVEDLVSYHLRINYLDDIADGVGERLFTINDSFLNSAPFKSAGWRPNPALVKRTHSPPIPTAVASDYFQAPYTAGLKLDDDGDEPGMLAGGGTETVGPGVVTKRRRRREQMEAEDSSDLSDESDDEIEQRAAQKISFSKMPVRNRSGSSPIQSSNLRQTSNVSSPRVPAPRRGSQSALETVKERARRDTVTSSEVSSDNEFDASGFHKAREAARAAERAVKLSTKMSGDLGTGPKRQEAGVLGKGVEEEEDEEDDDEDEDESENTDNSSAFGASPDSISLVQVVEQRNDPLPSTQLVGTPPRDFTRRSTIRKSAIPAALQVSSLNSLPPPQPLSTIRPVSMVLPKSLISAALNASKATPTLPFMRFASFSGKGDPNPLRVKIFAPFSSTPTKAFEVLIRRSIHEGEGSNRTVTVADLIGLSLWRYNEESMQPSLPKDRLNVNWWTLRMVEEDGEVDDDFPPLERKKPLTSFTTANNRAGRARSNSKVYDVFGLVQASPDAFAENQLTTPEYGQEETGGAEEDSDATPKHTPMPDNAHFEPVPPRPNPLLNTTWSGTTSYADVPSATRTAAPVRAAVARGEKKLLRIHMHSTDIPPGQMVTLDVTTDKYLQEILEEACRKRQLDVASHVLKFPGSGLIVPLDQPVASIGSVADLDLYRRRFGTDGVLTMTGSGSPSGTSPRLLGGDNASLTTGKAKRRPPGPHPLAREALVQKDLGLDMSYKKYTVNRRGRMRMGLTDTRSFSVDGEYIHITDANGKKSTIHFSSVLGCKVSRKHPTHFKFTVYRDPREPNKVYDFEARNADEAAEIVAKLQKGIAPYRDA